MNHTTIQEELANDDQVVSVWNRISLIGTAPFISPSGGIFCRQCLVGKPRENFWNLELYHLKTTTTFTACARMVHRPSRMKKARTQMP